MEALIDNKDHDRPSHGALNTDENLTEERTSQVRINEIANKAAGRGLERQRQDDAKHDIFTK